MMEENKRYDFRKKGDAAGSLVFRILGIGLILYFLVDLIRQYVALQGTAEEVPLWVLIASVAVLGGGAVLAAVRAWMSWKRDREAAVMTQEEIAQMEALREEEE